MYHLDIDYHLLGLPVYTPGVSSQLGDGARHPGGLRSSFLPEDRSLMTIRPKE